MPLFDLLVLSLLASRLRIFLSLDLVFVGFDVFYLHVLTLILYLLLHVCLVFPVHY